MAQAMQFQFPTVKVVEDIQGVITQKIEPIEE